ncbi:basic leucine zipper 6-like [Typha latifolia]|uniref:basic leucine zipper 6-like n=1 Tax=Typha latifolia TaxID=4733 RepID=UPI003C2F94CF
MAQLPPKVPNMAPNWPAFGHSAAVAVNQPSWINEFLDFAAAKRGAHRRSVSESIAFLEPAVDGGGVEHEFDRLDDDQLMSMFSDNAPPSSPSENNGITDEKPAAQRPKNESEEEEVEEEEEEQQSGCDAEAKRRPPSVVDPKRVKRILANRQSAQRSRVRKLQYISELERSVTTLQTEVSALSPRVAFLDHQRSLLTFGNSHLKQRIAALAQDKIFKDAHQEALRKEIERLRQVYHQQSLKKMAADSDPNNSLCGDKELLSCEGGTRLRLPS